MKSLKNEIQDKYSHGATIEALKTQYEPALVEKYVENQLCIDCDKFAEHFDPEQYCDKHYREYFSERVIEIPDWNSDNESIRRFGEQLASLDDSEVAIYEDRFFSTQV